MILLLNRYRLCLGLFVYLLPPLAFSIAWLVCLWVGWGCSSFWRIEFELLLLTTAIWAAMANRYGVCSIDELFRERTGVRGAIAATTSTYAIDIIVLFFVRGERFSRMLLVVSGIVLFLSTVALRTAFRYRLRRQSGQKRPLYVLMVGTDQFARHAAQRLHQTPFANCRVAAYVHLLNQAVMVKGAPIYEFDEIGSVDLTGVNDIVVAIPPAHLSELPAIVGRMEQLGRPVRGIVDLGENVIIREKLFQFGRLQLLNLSTTPADSLQYSIAKRIFDIAFSIFAIVITAPLLAVIAAAIKLTSPGPIFFRQERVGLNGDVFEMLKFRTMHVASKEQSDTAWTTENDPRRTWFGTLLRKSSLDELPQFFNVLKGDMSVVGPRPERPHFVRKFLKDIAAYDSRHQLKVGITGWAQVNGWRGDTSIRKRLEYDLYYLQNWSFSLDLRIIFLTLWSGLFGRNAY